jgi:RTX calcium-binding nonapeptide repeat (4 copies)
MGRARLVIWLVAIAAMAWFVPNVAAFTPPPDLACSHSGPPDNRLTFTIGTGEETVLLRREGDEIKLLSEHDQGTVKRKGKRKRTLWQRVFTAAQCSVTPTVHNTDTIRIRIEAEEIVDLDVSLEAGPLAPGATPEGDGTSEIETEVQQLTDFGHTIRFVGTQGADWFRFGAAGNTPFTPAINLNAQDEGSSPDADATLIPLPEGPSGVFSLPGLILATGGGDDRVTTAGGTEFDAPSPFAPFISGGPGNDTLSTVGSRGSVTKGGSGSDLIEAGSGHNLLFGGGGADTIVGGPNRDSVEPGKGRDVATLADGFDLVAALDHRRDRINCGPHLDLVAKDRKDRTPGCERRSFRPFHLKIFTD